MVAMPYILVNMVLDRLSLILFCVTSAAILSRYPSANLWLPSRLRNRRTLAFVAHGLVLSALLIVAVGVTGRLWSWNLFPPFIGDLLFFISLINSMVLAYQFLDKRYFLNKPKVQRRVLLAMVSVVITFVPFIAVVTVVFGLFIIR
jgi:hypothetical protein